ncbi:MAG: hypothetical protein DRP06_02005 [Candidatus Aenigmatarchaeota archaeon]|nr:MAG: hypothetical protein DRP06_02005 [Candidatus Aenigmarchaeota archaeon]
MDIKRLWIEFGILISISLSLALFIHLLITNQTNNLLALTSLLAIIVALFKEDILQHIKYPELNLTRSTQPEQGSTYAILDLILKN